MCSRILIVSSNAKTSATVWSHLSGSPSELDRVETLQAAALRVNSDKVPDLIYLDPTLPDVVNDYLPFHIDSTFSGIPVILVVDPKFDIDLLKQFYRHGVDSHIELTDGADCKRHILVSAKNCFLREEGRKFKKEAA